VLHVEEAFQQKTHNRESFHLLLGGERGGERVEGFDLGNSPSEYTKERVQGQGIIFSTTNGTRTLLALRGVSQTLIGSFLNISALCQYIHRQFQTNSPNIQEHTIIIACSGIANTFALEDTVCAGMFVHALSERFQGTEKTTAATAAEILYHHYKSDLPGMLRASDGGKKILQIGLGADLLTCTEVDKYTIIPKFREGKIVV
jgi:2-phosphosulfolactate phosphatase